MRQIDLSPSTGNPSSTSGLYLTEPTSGRLLLVAQAATQSSSAIATCAETLVTEGWNMLHVAVHPGFDADAVATMMLDNLVRATSELTALPTASLQIVAVADAVTALPACIATLQSHRQMQQPPIGGIVTIDAFEQPAATSTADRMPDIVAELAKLDGLASLIAAHRSSAATRRAGLSCHQQLQMLGRESHFMVLADSRVSLLERLANAHDALGREVRWLLDPVHSRNQA